METENALQNLTIIEDKPTFLTKVDFYGAESTKPDILSFDHREELEGVCIPLSSCQISILSFWFTTGDAQSLALRGLKADFKKNTEQSLYDSLEYTAEKAKDSDKEPDLLHFAQGEYIKSLTLVISEANGYIGGFEILTTMKDRKLISCGIQNVDSQDNKLPPGKKVSFDFAKDGGYLVGFYGQYNGEYITHLGGYVAPFKHLNYHIRRPYIVGYKILAKNKEILEEVGKKLGVQRDEFGRVKDAKLNDNSSKVFYYLCDSGANNYDLFRNVVDYLC